MSRAVAEKIGELPWRVVRVAAQPTEAALLDSLEALESPAVGKGREEAMGDDTAPGTEGRDEPAANGGDETPAALSVIGAFGGIRPMAHKLNVPVSTVQGWKERGIIPEARLEEIRAAR